MADLNLLLAIHQLNNDQPKGDNTDFVCDVAVIIEEIRYGYLTFDEGHQRIMNLIVDKQYLKSRYG
jgi:hypothetical protein